MPDFYVGVKINEGQNDFTKDNISELEYIKENKNFSSFVRNALKLKLEVDSYDGKVIPLNVTNEKKKRFLKEKEYNGYDIKELIAEKGIEFLMKDDRGELNNFDLEDIGVNISNLKKDLELSLEENLKNLDNTNEIEEKINNALNQATTNLKETIQEEINSINVEKSIKDVISKELPKYLKGKVVAKDESEIKDDSKDEIEEIEEKTEEENNFIKKLKSDQPAGSNFD